MLNRNGLSSVLTALFLMGAYPASAETHLWSRMYGGTNAEYAFDASVNAGGAVAVAGYFWGTVDFGGGPLVSAGSSDIFVARYDVGGNHVWSKHLGSTGGDVALGVLVDDDDSVILTGYFDGTVDFGGGPLVSAGGIDIFLAKYDKSGDHVWSRSFGSTGFESGADIALDASGNVYFTGYLGDTLSFGGGDIAGPGGADVFLVKLDGAGNHIWSVAHGGAGTDTGWNIACSENDVVLAGYFDGTADFGGGGLTSEGDTDIFLAKYGGAAGTHLWSKSFGSAQDEQPAGVGVDGAGRVALTGYFHETVDFGGGGLTSVDSDDIFLAQYDAAGNHLWSKRFGGIAQDKIYGLTVSGSDDILITGGFPNTIDFGGGVLTRTGNYDDLFLARFDSLGTHVWSGRFGSTLDDAGRAVGVDGYDNVVIAGIAETDIDFGGGLLPNQGFYDVFVAKFQAPQPTAAPTVPSDLELHQNVPNPFNPSTRIPYSLPADGHAVLRVYDVSGRLVRTLIAGWTRSGPGVAQWDGRDGTGAAAGSGVYFCRLSTSGRTITRKMVLLK